MIRHFSIALLFLFLVSISFSFALEELPAELAKFLASRKLLTTVHFAVGSAALDERAKRKIDQVVARLKEVDLDQTLIRIEGFASPEGSFAGNISLSMRRAKSVQDYLRNRHQLQADLFLTGFCARGKEEADPEKLRRVEIALYRNVFAVDSASIEQIIIR